MPDETENTPGVEESTPGGKESIEYSPYQGQVVGINPQEYQGVQTGYEPGQKEHSDILENPQILPGAGKEGIQGSKKNTQRIQKKPPGSSKKTSINLPPDLRIQVESSLVGQNQEIIAALRFYYSASREQWLNLQADLDEKNRIIAALTQEKAVLEARLTDHEYLKAELDQVHRHLTEQTRTGQGYLAQLQSVLEDKRKQEYLLQQREEKILQLEEAKKAADEKPKKKGRKKYFLFGDQV